MNELEPRKVVGAGLLAAGFSLIILALFVAVPATSWAQKDKDQYGGGHEETRPSPPAKPVERKVGCWQIDLQENYVGDFVSGKCDTAYAFSVFSHEGNISVCCVPK